MTLRCATEADAEVVAELSAQLDYPVEVEVVRSRLKQFAANPEHSVLVAEHHGHVCGWVHAHVQQSLVGGARGEILGLVVAREVRRAGIGRLLMQEAERWVCDRGLDMMVLRSNVKRPESHTFYPALGYEHFRTQAAYRKRVR